MTNNRINSLDELPAMLTVSQLAAALNISRTSAYELTHQKSFPALLIGSRIVVPKNRLLAWIDEKLARCELAG